MSFNLPDVDLTGATAGMTGKILLNNVGVSAGGISANPAFLNNPAQLYFFNESGAGLGMTCKDSATSFNLPAGAWALIPIKPGESEIDYQVKYTLPQPPVNTLMITYYAPNEDVPQTHTLGNSPVNGGTTVSGTTLSNETNAAGFEVIDIGTPGNTKAIDIFNDHFVWNVIQSGVVHQVLKGQTSGVPLQVGQSTDVVEVLGGLQVDVILHTLSQVTMDGANGIGLNASSTTIVGGLNGTANCYQFLSGTIKAVLIICNQFRTGAVNQDYTLPVAFTSKALIVAGDIDTCQFLLSGATQNVDIVTTLAVSGGTSTNTGPQTSNGISACTHPFDTIRFNSGAGSNHNGLMLVIGV